MTKPSTKRDSVREARIHDEIIVDAYGPEEQALSWYYYLQEKLNFPFKAKCVTEKTISPLKRGEKVEVIEMAPEDDCMHDMFVLIRFAARTMGVPLAQLEAINVASEAQEAMEDWRYWISMGYQF